MCVGVVLERNCGNGDSGRRGKAAEKKNQNRRMRERERARGWEKGGRSWKKWTVDRKGGSGWKAPGAWGWVVRVGLAAVMVTGGL